MSNQLYLIPKIPMAVGDRIKQRHAEYTERNKMTTDRDIVFLSVKIIASSVSSPALASDLLNDAVTALRDPDIQNLFDGRCRKAASVLFFEFMR